MSCLRVVLLAIILASTLSAVTGISLARYVLDPSANAVFHLGAATIKATGVNLLYRSMVGTPENSALGTGSVRNPTEDAPSQNGQPTLGTQQAAPSSAKRNPLFLNGRKDGRLSPSAAYYRSGSVTELFSSAFTDGTPIRFAHLLDFAVEIFTVVADYMFAPAGSSISKSALLGGVDQTHLDQKARTTYESKNDWEALDAVISGGEQLKYKRALLLGAASGTDREHSGEEGCHIPVAGDMVNIEAIYVRAYRPTAAHFDLIAASGNGNLLKSLGLDSATPGDSSAQFEGDVRAAYVFDLSNEVSSPEELAKLTEELAAKANLVQEPEKDDSEPTQREDAAEDWRARMRREHEKKAKGAKTTVNPTTPAQKLHTIEQVFHRVTGNLTALALAAEHSVTGSVARAARYRLSSRTMIGCLDETLFEILRAGQHGCKGAAIHYVCPTASAFGRRGQKAFSIPPYAPMEVVLVGVSVEH